MSLFKAALRLYSIQICAFITIALGLFFQSLDLILTLAYLAILVLESWNQREFRFCQSLLLAFIWQGPALFMSIYVYNDLSCGGLNNYAFFVLQFWGTPLIPLWSLISHRLLGAYPLYYYLVIASPLLLAMIYLIFNRTFAPSKKSVGASNQANAKLE